MTYHYQPKGVCAREIEISVEDGIIEYVRFSGGCHGYQQGLASLLKGMSAATAIERLQGIQCGGKLSSCPDQLAQALIQITAKND